MTRTSIEWATDSWNPIAAYDRETGKRGWFCTKVSPGCTNCYAEQWNRFRGNGHLYRVGNLDKVRFELAPTLTDPLHWRKPRRVFVNSMTDLFLEAHTDEMIDEVFSVMGGAPEHQFLVLTKRPERMLAYMTSRGYKAWNSRRMDLEAWPARNVWLGVSVENQEQADLRIPLLVQSPATVRFLSCEPLLGPVAIPAFLDHPSPIHWVIVGGESGSKARPMDVRWLRSIVFQAQSAGCAVFIKQMGKLPQTADLTHWRATAKLLPDSSGYALKLRDRKGGDPTEWPTNLRVREYPREVALV